MLLGDLPRAVNTNWLTYIHYYTYTNPIAKYPDPLNLPVRVVMAIYAFLKGSFSAAKNSNSKEGISLET